MYEIAGYNIACCFSKLRQWENSLGALRDCLNSGYEDFEKAQTHPLTKSHVVVCFTAVAATSSTTGTKW
eukprot:1292592-Amorphochlora_amoeboformis.AAC.1